MTPEHVISELLASDTKYTKNILLLKKIIFTSYLGRFRVNSLSPDNSITLGNYLFDKERTLFDTSRLSDKKKKAFEQWFLEPHQQEKEKTYLNNVTTSEYHGFTSEVALNWWGKLMNWFLSRVSEHWKIANLSLSLNYQLTGIEMVQGEDGILIGFNQHAIPASHNKYQDPSQSPQDILGNTKRVLLTDDLVEQLIKTDLSHIKFETICKSPHPHSVFVKDYAARYKAMQFNKFVEKKPWYVRLWNWIVSLFTKKALEQKPVQENNNPLKLVHVEDSIKLYERTSTGEILVMEKKPDITNLVLCGGGSKIIGHLGMWKALRELNIIPKNFAGSSAGAIMGLMCYLGLDVEEIRSLFFDLKEEHLIFYDINMKGLSDSHSLKTALDYAIALKVKSITSHYNIPYPQGKITFKILDEIKKKCPGCGIGDELIVTATNKRLRKTQYFSWKRTPHVEVSEAVRTSASLPVIYRGNFIDGDEHNDGGLLSNFPTEVFHDDGSTFLESEYGNNLKLLGVQFDNGLEQHAVGKNEPVLRINFFMNWVYGILSGVRDPASGWEQDLLKLRKYASQSIIIDVNNVSATSFTVSDEDKAMMGKNGYDATMDYINTRYRLQKGQKPVNEEYMYTTFGSLDDLLAYCCYRGNQHWFDVVHDLIVASSAPGRAALMKKSLELRQLYFAHPKEPSTDLKAARKERAFFDRIRGITPAPSHPNELMALYPIFLKLTPELVCTSKERKKLEKARHALSLHAPFDCLAHFESLHKQMNIHLHILIQLIKELKHNATDSIYAALKDMEHLFCSAKNVFNKAFYGVWNLNLSQSLAALKWLPKHQEASSVELTTFLQKLEKPTVADTSSEHPQTSPTTLNLQM